MRNRTTLILVWLTLASTAQAKQGLTVHEWGTFTTVAGKDGVAVDWEAQSAKGDLPSFVYTAEALSAERGTRNAYRDSGKGGRHLVRMETPVLYFYSDVEQEVSVRVDFPKGRITEWFPHALTPSPGQGGFIDWGRFKVMPSLKTPLPDEHRPSHYYAAREVDAAPLQLCGGQQTEVEKFLFYRGVGELALPLNARLEGDQLALSQRAAGGSAIRAMVFERRGERVGYRWASVGKDAANVHRPELTGSLPEVLHALEAELTSTGLYPKEAQAMVKTWKDQWFEEGLRVFYVLPRAATDAALPLTVEPRPDSLVRTMVTRVEVLTPEQIRAVRSQLGGPELQKALAPYGRFAQVMLERAEASLDE
jgi:hypothetical protein